MNFNHHTDTIVDTVKVVGVNLGAVAVSYSEVLDPILKTLGLVAALSYTSMRIYVLIKEQKTKQHESK